VEVAVLGIMLDPLVLLADIVLVVQVQDPLLLVVVAVVVVHLFMAVQVLEVLEALVEV
jgi:hypothetical protein